jgi:pimeloyl-ACP methyl ester carboxylesterase
VDRLAVSPSSGAKMAARYIAKQEWLISKPSYAFRIATNGIILQVAEAGPTDGPATFLLHGFPESWYGWRNQIEPLAQRGLHVIVPEQRGYNLSGKPKGIGSYDLDQLSADVVGLADHFYAETFSVCGHDWGISVGWWLAGRHSKRLQRSIALNAPHPAVWLDAMRNDPIQKRKGRICPAGPDSLSARVPDWLGSVQSASERFPG